MRMCFESIRLGLASRPTPRVTLAIPPPIHHRLRLPPIYYHHSRPRRRIRSVLPLSSKTRYLTLQLVSRPNGMRPRSTASSSARMWRPSELTCAQSWPTRRPSFQSVIPPGPARPDSHPSPATTGTSTVIWPITREISTPSLVLSLTLGTMSSLVLGGVGDRV